MKYTGNTGEYFELNEIDGSNKEQLRETWEEILGSILQSRTGVPGLLPQ